ncbi:MAG: AAA family ATPase [Candidatus Altiarchaeota archaeon]|nr:AAA family ATPase [Candidatus Altiarchaeota archaeon]
MLIFIAGTSASGKTLVADELVKKLDSALKLSLDEYFFSKQEILKMNIEKKWDDPRAVDWALLNKNLQDLINKKPAQVPVYDFLNERTGFRKQEPAEIIIVEGLWTLGDWLKTEPDLTVFIDADPDKRLARRVLRDMTERGKTKQKVISWWKKRIRPGELEFVLPYKDRAELLLHSQGIDTMVEAIYQKIQELGKA